MKTIPKIITITFLIIFIFQLVSLLFLLLMPNATSAADPVPFTPQVSIPGSDFTAGADYEIDKSTKPIAEYISAIYNYSVAIVGILAVAVLVFAGAKWILSGGSPEKLTDAKAWIGAALTGLVLVMVSYMLLTMINPRLTNFQILNVQKVENKEKIGCCQYNDDSNYQCGNAKEEDCESQAPSLFDYESFSLDKTCNPNLGKCIAADECLTKLEGDKCTTCGTSNCECFDTGILTCMPCIGENQETSLGQCCHGLERKIEIGGIICRKQEEKTSCCKYDFNGNNYDECEDGLDLLTCLTKTGNPQLEENKACKDIADGLLDEEFICE